MNVLAGRWWRPNPPSLCLRSLFDRKLMLKENFSGWLLVEADLKDARPGHVIPLKIYPDSPASDTREILLPLLLNGQVEELVHIPKGTARVDVDLPEGCRELRQAFKVKPVGRFERLWRMWNRVIWTYAALSNDERKRTGLTVLRCWIDLTGAYKATTELRIQYPPLPYADWIASFDALNENDLQRIAGHIGRFARRPRYQVLIDAEGCADARINATLESLRAQCYHEFACTVLTASRVVADTGIDVRAVDTAGLSAWLPGFNAGLGADWVLRLRAGDTLSAHALYWFACMANDHPEATVIYADDDALDAAGQRCAPRFKPDWSLAHLRATNYPGDAVAVRGDVLTAVGGVDVQACRYGLYDILLQVFDNKQQFVIHLPAPLLHRSAPVAATDDTAAWELEALQCHLGRRGVAAEVTPTLPGCRRVRHLLPESPPLVSIIVPTRDALDMLRRCVESVLGKTTYPRFELLLVDNQSSEPQALAWLRGIAAHPALRVLPYDHPFNFSAINNFAAQAARGEVLCLLNNDTEVISPDWLDEMVGHLLQPQVGVVGAKLYYPDGRVQHAGDTVGPGGCANHLHSRIARDDPGYCNRAAVAQGLSAVTAACLVTRRDLFLELGGLDARRLKVAFNDVDYCLRVRAAGQQVIWTPHAELYHHESVSRGKDNTPAKQRRTDREAYAMRRRWGQVMRNDPFYNPNLNYRRPDFTPGRTLRVRKPWL